MLPRCIKLTLFTLVDFKKDKNLNNLIDVFEKFPIFCPRKWAKDDRAKSKCPYDRQALAEMVKNCSDMDMPMLYGSKVTPYESYFGFETNRQNPTWKYLNGIYWDLDIPSHFQEISTAFEFSRQLADVAQPEWGQINLVWDHPEIGQLISPGIQRDDLQENGVPSLGIRSWVGPHIISQIGIEKLQFCGAVTQQTSWGGIELDLVEKPWLADFDTLLQAKQHIMKNLEPSGVFGDYSNYPLPLYTPAPKWIPVPLE
jgi:hypothetical protein